MAKMNRRLCFRIRQAVVLASVALAACESARFPGASIPKAERAITAADARACEDIVLRIYAKHGWGAMEGDLEGRLEFAGSVRRTPSQISRQARADYLGETKTWINEIYGPPLRELILRGVLGPVGGPGWINYDFVYETQDTIAAEKPVVRIGQGEIDNDRGRVVVPGVLNDATGSWNAAGTQLWVFGQVDGKWKVCDFISHGQSFAGTLSGG